MANRFKLYDFTKNGKGVSKDEDDGKHGLVGFFKQYKRKFSRLLSVNIFMVLGNFPLFFLGMAYAGYGAYHTMIPNDPMLFPVAYAFRRLSASPIGAALYAVFGLQKEWPRFSVISYILLGLSLLFLITFGLTNVGTTYILRNLARGDAVFMWSDFWYAIKRNWKQGIIMGILDLLILVLLIFNIRFYFYGLNNTFLNGIQFYIAVAMLFLWFFMRFYIYILLVTFDLKIFKIFKNALIFAIIGFKRNFMALLGLLLLVFLNFAILYYIQPLGIVLPLVLTLSNGAFMTTYAAYFKIKEIMIDPLEADAPAPPAEEPLAKDDVS